MLTLLSLVSAQAAPYVLDFGVVGVTQNGATWNLHEDLFAQLNSGVVDVELSQFAGDPTLTWQRNGVNQITWSSSSAVHGGFPMQALWWTSNGVTECDIGVRSTDSWTASDAVVDHWSYGSSTRPIGTTMMHELGHCLKLGHLASEYNIMGSDWNHVSANGGQLYFYMGEDAADRLVTLHDVNASFEDVGVVHWKYLGNPDGDAYSDHRRTEVLNPSYQALASFTEDSGDTPVYLVRRGATIRPEFTFENNGATNSVQVDVSYRLSSNDLITSSDTVLGTTTLNLNRDNVATYAGSVVVPASTPPGRYFLGARLDDLVNLGDDVGQNNATYVDIEVLAKGDQDYCLGPTPCGRFEGDCDSDAQCGSGLVCVSNVGAQYGWAADVDVCDYPVGHESYCTPAAPCGLYEGDCDSNADCATGYCASNVGAQYGWAATVDVCQPEIVFGF